LGFGVGSGTFGLAAGGGAITRATGIAVGMGGGGRRSQVAVIQTTPAWSSMASSTATASVRRQRGGATGRPASGAPRNIGAGVQVGESKLTALIRPDQR